MSEIERYLDELFDRMSGTGAAGRRALAEAEDHLRSAAADAMAVGRPADQAEREAVARFGPAALVARRLRSANGASSLNRALSAAWLLAGLAACGLGVAYLAAAGRLGWSAPDCTVVLTRLCYLVGGPIARAADWAALAAVLGAMLLFSRWIAVACAGLAPVRRGSVISLGLIVVMAGLAAGAAGRAPIPLIDDPFNLMLPRPAYLVIATALLECVAATATLASPRYVQRPWRLRPAASPPRGQPGRPSR